LRNACDKSRLQKASIGEERKRCEKSQRKKENCGGIESGDVNGGGGEIRTLDRGYGGQVRP